jgi:hypothetical protein
METIEGIILLVQCLSKLPFEIRPKKIVPGTDYDSSGLNKAMNGTIAGLLEVHKTIALWLFRKGIVAQRLVEFMLLSTPNP